MAKSTMMMMRKKKTTTNRKSCCFFCCSKLSYGRLLSIIILILFISLLFFFLLTSQTYPPPPRNNTICNRHLYPTSWQLRADQLTILITGFSQARLPLLQTIALAYSASPLVHSIFILWGNVSTPSSLLQTIDFASSGAPIFMVRQHTSSLNDRFLPRVFVRTRAVMICDDDITIELQSMNFAFQTWKENEDRIVGFFPRSHEYQISTRSWIYTIHPDKYSIMLTKLMILATEFLYIYTCNMPRGVKEYVDRAMNCEDIAMNFVVSNYTNHGPLLVGGKPRDWGDPRNTKEELSNSALSARGQHRKDRGDCITEFHKLWHHMPLHYSYTKAIDSVEEQVLCEKFGSIVPCSQHIMSS